MPYYESEELDVAWHLDDGASTLSNFAISSNNWVAQAFKPDWATIAPGQTVTSWYITSVSVRVGKLSGGTGNINCSIRAVDVNGKPTGSDLDLKSIANASVPVIATTTTQPATFSTVSFVPQDPGQIFYPNDSAAFVMRNSASGTSYVGCQTNGTVQSPSDQARTNSLTSGNSWTTPSTTIDVIIEVKGRYKVIPGVAVPPLDSATTDTITAGTGATTRTFAHTVGTNDGNDTVLYVAVPHFSTSETDGMCTGVTYAGIDMLEVEYSGAQVLTDGVLWVKWFRLIAPPTGTNNVVATFSSANHQGVIAAASFFQVHQSEPEGGTDAKLAGSGDTFLNKMEGIIGDMNLVAGVWDSRTATSTTVVQGNTTTIAGSASATNIIGCVVGYSVGDVPTGWQTNGTGGFGLALGIVGVNHVQGVNWPIRNVYLAPAEYSFSNSAGQ